MNNRMPDNPWEQLPTTAPYVLPMDQDVVDQFNAHSGTTEKFRLQTHLYPEPFIGDPASPVYFLCLNPGYSDQDDHWHRQPKFTKTLLRNLTHDVGEYPFYFSNPEYKETPGASWWRAKSRWLAEKIGTDTLSRKIFWVELFPYHSSNFKPVPRTISPNGLVPSVNYGIDLVRRAMLEEKLIVAMRSWRLWRKRIPELESYPHLLRLRSSQSVWLSPGNVIGFEKLIETLRE